LQAPTPDVPRTTASEDWGIVVGGYAVLTVAALVMLGWKLGIDLFVTMLPGLAPMVFNTALSLALMGVVAVFLGLRRERHPVALAASGAVWLLAVLTLVEYGADVSLGVDTIFHHPERAASMAEPGRMGLNTAVALGLLASAALSGAVGGRRALRAALWLSVAVIGVAALALAGYVGGYASGYRWGAATGMAAHSAGCLLLLGALFATDYWRRWRGRAGVASWALALAAAALLLLSVGWVAHRGLDALVGAFAEVGRAREADDRLRDLQLQLARFEAERGAWLLAGAPAPGPSGASARLRALAAEVEGLVDDAKQAERARRLSRLIEENLGLLPSGAEAAELAARWSAVPARELRAEIDGLALRMQAREKELLAAREARGARAAAEARVVILCGITLALLCGFGGVWLLRRILADLRESRERLASIFTSVAEGLVLQDARGRILECNGAAERILGLSAALMNGVDSLDPRWRAVREDGTPCSGESHPAMRTLRTGRAQRDETMGVFRPDGSLVWLSINAEPIFGDSGRVLAVVTSFFDITARRHAEQALRESEERWKFAIEGTGDGLWDWDVLGGRVVFSSRWKAMLGYAEDEIGDSLAEWRSRVHPEDLVGVLRAVQDHLDGRSALYLSEHRVRCKDGAYRWILGRGRIVSRGADGRPLRLIGTHSDLSERRAAEQALRESEERFRNTFDHAGVGMAIVALDGRWQRVNAALSRILGYTEEELLRRSSQDLTHPDDLDADLVQSRRLLAGEIASYQMEKRCLHREGHPVWIRLTGSLVRDGGGAPVHFVAQIEDITDRRLAAGKLAAYARRLATRNRDLQDFAHVASHDLQEPLRKIQAFGDRLEGRAAARLEPEERDYLARMRAAAARMSALIDALLAYSRVGSRAGTWENVPLAEALGDALQDLELRLESTGGRVEAGPLPVLRADPVQMRQLLQNLVGNGLKYSRAGVAPLVRVSSAPAATGVLASALGPAWELRVADNGIGFEQRHAEAIFGVFHRLHGRDEYGGAGVGLAICRRIVERHGGLIRAEGRVGEGAVFVVVLPEAAPPDLLDA
jgi:PAS domain S-box-containing protein